MFSLATSFTWKIIPCLGDRQQYKTCRQGRLIRDLHHLHLPESWSVVLAWQGPRNNFSLQGGKWNPSATAASDKVYIGATRPEFHRCRPSRTQNITVPIAGIRMLTPRKPSKVATGLILNCLTPTNLSLSCGSESVLMVDLFRVVRHWTPCENVLCITYSALLWMIPAKMWCHVSKTVWIKSLTCYSWQCFSCKRISSVW